MSSETKPCPFCASSIPLAADVCPNCTRRLNIHPAFKACAVLVLGAVAMIVAGFWFLATR